MACSVCSQEDMKSIINELQDSSDIDKMFDNAQKEKRRTSLLITNQDNIICLNRGGIIIKSEIGPIQFGIPPETIKDSINLGQEVPTFYILPSVRFSKKFGINVADCEFPAYFNFFVKKRKVTLICTKEAETAIRTIFQETLLGPLKFEDFKDDFYYTYPNDAIPDIAKELAYFAKNPMNPNDPLTIDKLLNFAIFDQNTNTVEIKEKDQIIQIKKDDDIIEIYQNGRLFEQFKDVVILPQEKSESQITISEEQIMAPGSNNNSIASLNHINSYDNIDQFKEKPDSQNQRFNTLIWNEKGCSSQNMAYIERKNMDKNETFVPPDFGITVLGASHGFDPKGNTSGFLIWVYGVGIMVDPPPYAMNYLKKMGLSSKYVKAIIISHCHSDHDAGTFQKILDASQIEIITTRTIMNSFLRKYSVLTNIEIQNLEKLFIFRPAIVGHEINIYGAQFQFFYSFHSIPTIGFQVQVEKKSLFYSADMFYNPEQLLEIKKQGIFSEKRYQQLAQRQFNQDIILHEAGVPPIHTPQAALLQLNASIRNKIYLIHIAEKDLMKNSGLKIIRQGIENTLIINKSNENTSNFMQRRLTLLATIDLFQSLTIKNIMWLLDTLVVEKYNPKDIIIQEGSIGNKFYIIENGVGRIYSDNKDNKFERYLSIGDYFGEVALICMGGKRVATVEAVTDVTVLTLEKHDFWLVFGDSHGKPGPIITKFLNLTQVRKSKALNILYKNDVFNEMTLQQKTSIEMILKEQEVQKNQVIWKAKDKAQFALLVKKGTFEFIDCPESKIEGLSTGAFIGETKAMIENKPLTTTLMCSRAGIIYKMDKISFLDFLKNNPGLMMTFMDVKYFE